MTQGLSAKTGVMLKLSFLLPLILSVSGLMLTPAQKSETLDTHNRLRRSVYPSAADMNFLTWNPYLEDLAQQAANRCVFEHNYNGPYQNLGENLYQGYRTNVTDIMTFFFLEKLAYDYARKACNLANSLGLSQCGHYYQLAGASVSEVGCAIAECGVNKYLLVCEYNRMYPSNVYTSGAPCSACPQSAGYCLNGLCLNGSLARDAQLIAREGNATCSVVCKNCGSALDNRTATPPVCQCACPTGLGGRDCSALQSSSAQPPSSCGACAAAGSPCLNGGAESAGSNSSGACTGCQCPANFTGPRCQLAASAYTSGALLRLRGGLEFCTGGNCARIPLGYGEFIRNIWPALSSALATGINTYCRGSPGQCCPAVSASGAGSLSATTLVSSADLGYVDFSIKTAQSGDLEVAVYAVPPAGNSLCSAAAAGTGRRRRAAVAAAATPLSVTALSAAVAAANGSIASSLGGISVASVSDYKTAVDALFGYGSSGGGGSVNAGSWASGSVASLICFAASVTLT